MSVFLVFSVIVILLMLKSLLRFCQKDPLLNPQGKAIFISGCDSGIGRHLANYFDAAGCTVFAGCLRPENACRTFSDSVRVLPLDITSEDSVKKAVEEMKLVLEEENLDLWCLINNAGVCVYGEFDWLTMDQCAQQVQVNLLGTIRLTKACLSLIRKSRGRILNITSINGFIAYPGIAVYSATKFALEGFSDSLRIELKRHGVRVIVIQPADFARLTSIMSDHEAKAQQMWEAMDPENKRFYGDYFRQYQQATMKNYGLTSPKTFEESPLLLQVEKAVLGENPESRYISATLTLRLFYTFLAYLPHEWRDYILMKIFEYVMKN